MKHLLAALCIPVMLLLAGCPDTKLPKPPSQIPEPKAASPVSGAPAANARTPA
ncbi:hypothetical protein [Polaromonas sp. YR568]|uniref:hypothetical protein n=1 Tax=Polaromonas sp. YR568 TaxID=1855301 RepID=UPI0031378528